MASPSPTPPSLRRHRSLWILSTEKLLSSGGYRLLFRLEVRARLSLWINADSVEEAFSI